MVYFEGQLKATTFVTPSRMSVLSQVLDLVIVVDVHCMVAL